LQTPNARASFDISVLVRSGSDSGFVAPVFAGTETVLYAFQGGTDGAALRACAARKFLDVHQS
jgi:hypothetical protein